ncbi:MULTISPECIES: hypothetical protein [unclassified Meiothermus]|uniref:hypothetical protein n=1 Tax=unclassified Meiothermus TaxID=370471 RepID=UPI000D7CB6C4|nr:MULTISPECIES: hypothetical protein [unclassified Meiothermus]PZA06064.1 hypothetical protein DNA98_15535 [Meiothermus sp. Pnk-1]RYM31410.1 hypothetical protein EWH23_14765 [Meiothermus sp. PNK-Is4]
MFFRNPEVREAFRKVGLEACEVGGFWLMMDSLQFFRQKVEAELGPSFPEKYYPHHLAEVVSGYWSGICKWQR